MLPEKTQMMFRALTYAADKHRDQRRKDERQVPYINHPIELVDLLVQVGQVEDMDVIAAALLHDTIEDTSATEEELCELFGESVCQLVLEVTDDKSLPKGTRKKLQIQEAPNKSHKAKLIILADKTCNIRDLCRYQLPGWSDKRRQEYFVWARRVVDQIRGTNATLEALFDEWNERGLASPR